MLALSETSFGTKIHRNLTNLRKSGLRCDKCMAQWKGLRHNKIEYEN